MKVQILFDKQEERFLSTDLIARCIASNGFVLACSSDEQVCQAVSSALLRPSSKTLYCDGAKRPYGVLINPVRWQMLCRFIKELPQEWLLDEDADLPPNAELIAFLRAFIRQEVLLRPDLPSVNLLRPPTPEDMSLLRKHIKRRTNPFGVDDIGGKWLDYVFALPEPGDGTLPIETWFKGWQDSILRESTRDKSYEESNDPLLRRIGSGSPVPAEQIFGNDQGRTSERRTSHLDN